MGSGSAALKPMVFSQSCWVLSLPAGSYLLQSVLTSGLRPMPRGSQAEFPCAPHDVAVARLYELTLPAASRKRSTPWRSVSVGTRREICAAAMRRLASNFRYKYVLAHSGSFRI